MLDDRGHAHVFDYKAIKEAVRTPYAFEPYKPPQAPCPNNYSGTAEYWNCACAGGSGPRLCADRVPLTEHIPGPKKGETIVPLRFYAGLENR